MQCCKHTFYVYCCFTSIYFLFITHTLTCQLSSIFSIVAHSVILRANNYSISCVYNVFLCIYYVVMFIYLWLGNGYNEFSVLYLLQSTGKKASMYYSDLLSDGGCLSECGQFQCVIFRVFTQMRPRGQCIIRPLQCLVWSYVCFHSFGHNTSGVTQSGEASYSVGVMSDAIDRISDFDRVSLGW